MRATLDSGILFRGSTSPNGPAARLISHLVPPDHRIVLSEYILEEFCHVLAYPRIKLQLSAGEIALRADKFRVASEIVEPASGPRVVLADPKDDPVVYTAVSGRADVLCTLDNHFHAANVIEFLGRYAIRVRTDVELLRELLT